MPNTFNLNQDETTYINARPEERKRVSVGQDASIRHEGKDWEKFGPEKAVEIDHPVTVQGAGHFSVEGIDTEPTSPARKVLDHDDVGEPSSAAVAPSTTVEDKPKPAATQVTTGKKRKKA